jgi:hypothetical protein
MIADNDNAKINKRRGDVVDDENISYRDSIQYLMFVCLFVIFLTIERKMTRRKEVMDF